MGAWAIVGGRRDRDDVALLLPQRLLAVYCWASLTHAGQGLLLGKRDNLLGENYQNNRVWYESHFPYTQTPTLILPVTLTHSHTLTLTLTLNTYTFTLTLTLEHNLFQTETFTV